MVWHHPPELEEHRCPPGVPPRGPWEHSINLRNHTRPREIKNTNPLIPQFPLDVLCRLVFGPGLLRVSMQVSPMFDGPVMELQKCCLKLCSHQTLRAFWSGRVHADIIRHRAR